MIKETSINLCFNCHQELLGVCQNNQKPVMNRLETDYRQLVEGLSEVSVELSISTETAPTVLRRHMQCGVNTLTRMEELHAYWKSTVCAAIIESVFTSKVYKLSSN